MIITYSDIQSVINEYLSIEIFDRMEKLGIEKLVSTLIPMSSINFGYDLSYALGPKIKEIKLFQDVCVLGKDYIENNSFLLLDSILDTGKTMDNSVNTLKELGAKNIITCTLLKKDRKDKVCNFNDYNHIYGFLIPDYFVVGYGLDLSEKFRNIKNIFNYRDIEKYISEKGESGFYEYSISLGGERYRKW